MTRGWGIWLSALFLALVFACGPARRGPPIASVDLQGAEEKGQRHFMHHCHQCHPGGAAGVGPAINNKPLPRWLMRLQVRRGLGAMPSFSEKDLSEEHLEAILDYLEALRSQAG